MANSKVAAYLNKALFDDSTTGNIPELVAQWQRAELRALKVLRRITRQKKKSLTKKEKQEVLDILVDYGITPSLFILVGYALGADASKAGRPIDYIKRSLIMDYFITQGYLPTIRSGHTGRRKKDDADGGIIAECAKTVDQQVANFLKVRPSGGNNLTRTENTRNLITALLNSKDFRQSYTRRLKDALHSSSSPIAEVFVRHMQCTDTYRE